MKLFKDRKSAGKLLAKRLTHFTDDRRVIVLGIPRGGVVVAKEVAKQLNLPLDILVTRKIGAPMQLELALGAIDPDGEVVWDRKLLSDLGFTIHDLRETVENEVREIKRREREYRHARPDLARLVRGKDIVLVDDGIATGATTLSAINYLKRHQAKKIILAVPVASKEAVDRVVRELGPLRPRSEAREFGPPAGEAGEVIVLETPQYFQAVGQFYQNFEPVEDQEVVELLNHG